MAETMEQLVSSHLPNLAGDRAIAAIMARSRANEIVRSLCDAMRRWGSEEDGIPEEFWSAYVAGRAFIGDDVDESEVSL